MFRCIVVTRHTLALAAAVSAALLVPAAAQAKPCPKIVTSPDDPAAVVDHHQEQVEGGALEGGKIRFPGHFYEATAEIVVKVRGNTYWIEEGSTFKFSCYGSSASDKRLKPALDLLEGSVKVKTVSGRPGGVMTPEGLYDPRKDSTMVFTVKRTLTSDAELTLDDMMAWFANLRTQRLGTTTVTAPKSGPIVGVTPYVGQNSGSCRYVHGARLTSTGYDSKGFTKGRATYSA